MNFAYCPSDSNGNILLKRGIGSFQHRCVYMDVFINQSLKEAFPTAMGELT